MTSEETLRLTEFVGETEGRYHRQSLIPWWEQETIRSARVLVVGVGALGNEILKLLALTGVGNIFACDMDRIEASNLNRSVLFRQGDESLNKVDVAVRRVNELNPDVRVRGFNGNILHELGLGVFAWADIVIGGLDNREARVFINAAAASHRRLWIDGSIEGLNGIVRVFNPASSACYECTMNSVDRRLLSERRSCSVLMRDALLQGHVPNTAVTASLVASLQVMEAIKSLHGQPVQEGTGLHITGLTGDFSRVTYPRRDDCLGHTIAPPLEPLGAGVHDITLEELMQRAERRFGEGCEIALSRDMVAQLECYTCQETQWVGRPVGSITEKQAACPTCGEHRIAHFISALRRDDVTDWKRTAADLGIPPYDVIVVRKNRKDTVSWLFDGDESEVLGPLNGCVPTT